MASPNRQISIFHQWLEFLNRDRLIRNRYDTGRTMSGGKRDEASEEDCTVPTQPIPPSEIARYSADRDPDAEADIAHYVELEARDEIVQHVERVRTDFIMGEKFEAWDVVTNKDRWWVITNLTNLYSQRNFPSLDYTLSFHVGLMARLRSRPEGADSGDPDPFDEVFRRQQQAKDRHDSAVEAEDFQAVGLQLRECLISLITVMRRRVELDQDVVRPKDSDFASWIGVLMAELCSGGKNKQLRQYLKSASKGTWQLVNWLTHDRDANAAASSICIHACDTIIGHFIQLLVREKTGDKRICPQCSSRDLRTHFDPFIDPDGAYYVTCGSCHWSDHSHLHV